MINVHLGDEVQDKVTGFKGVATCIAYYLQGCERVEVQPQVDKDGKLQDSKMFDEPLLKVLKRRKISVKEDSENGGPKDHSTIPRR